MASWSHLLLTKLHRPALAPQHFQRPQLVARLQTGLAAGHRLTLVSAPAGFGKTTCVAEWLNTVDRPVAWLALDRADNTPQRFCAYLIAALQLVDSGLGRDLAAVLRADHLPPAEVISTSLLNAILALDRRFVLVIDDFQVIHDPYILKVCEQLVTNLPPMVHLVLVTRADPALPLARLRANNQLTEIRSADLRFSPSEAEQFLNRVMHLELPPPAVASLTERTEGWVVGLQLAALSVRDHADPAAFVATLGGSHRYILSYLTEEVLNRQPAPIREFLLQTALLERFNGDLCNTVTGRSDSHAVLEQLLHANLFLIPLDDEQHWYRYHHLFADLLRELQQAQDPVTTIELHRRAAHWYAQATLPDEAFHHALAAADYALALQLVERYAMDMILAWRTRTAHDWLQALPAEWLARSPRANFAQAWMQLMAGAPAAAELSMERLQALFDEPQSSLADPLLQAEWLALQAARCNLQQQPHECQRLAERALTLAPPQASYLHSLIFLQLAGSYQQLNLYERAAAAYQIMIQHGQAAANIVAEILGLAGLGLLALQHGRLHFAYQTAVQGVARLEQAAALHPISIAIHGELGEICYQWHQLAAAHEHFARAAQVSYLSGYSDATIYLQVFLSRRYLMDGTIDAAAAAIEQALELMQAAAPVQVREEVVEQQVRVYLAQQQLTAAMTLLQRHNVFKADGTLHSDLLTHDRFSYRQGVLACSAVRVLLHQGHAAETTSRLHMARELASQLLHATESAGFLPLSLETLLLRAQVSTALADDHASRTDYEQALALAAPEDCITVFVAAGDPVATALAQFNTPGRARQRHSGFIRRVLAAFATHPPFAAAAAPVPFEALTDREREILRLIAAGLKYREIADQLCISLNTVRFHVKTVYAKLQVDNRVKAIECAREYHLI